MYRDLSIIKAVTKFQQLADMYLYMYIGTTTYIHTYCKYQEYTVNITKKHFIILSHYQLFSKRALMSPTVIS